MRERVVVRQTSFVGCKELLGFWAGRLVVKDIVLQQ